MEKISTEQGPVVLVLAQQSLEQLDPVKQRSGKRGRLGKVERSVLEGSLVKWNVRYKRKA